MNLEDLAVDDGTLVERAEAAGHAVREFLGVAFEAHVCPDCQTACEPAETYDTARAAEYGGKAPSWHCPDCGTHYVREQTEVDNLSGDMYGRG